MVVDVVVAVAERSDEVEVSIIELVTVDVLVEAPSLVGMLGGVG